VCQSARGLGLFLWARAQVRERNSIIFYTVYWGLTAILYLLALLDETQDSKGQFSDRSHVALFDETQASKGQFSDRSHVALAFTFLFMSKAVVSLLVCVLHPRAGAVCLLVCVLHPRAGAVCFCVRVLAHLSVLRRAD
jgi:hypothetical protein